MEPERSNPYEVRKEMARCFELVRRLLGSPKVSPTHPHYLRSPSSQGSRGGQGVIRRSLSFSPLVAARLSCSTTTRRRSLGDGKEIESSEGVVRGIGRGSSLYDV